MLQRGDYDDGQRPPLRQQLHERAHLAAGARRAAACEQNRMLRPGVDPALNDGARLLPAAAAISDTRAVIWGWDGNNLT